ncbi:hypothetical protein TESG_00835 [Trichophyton tonsurans CBS 112818]|uniref:Uncharacterized protein n=1 Tax=Trichophyton tonsurans (strain CBS 112818) TaxID=647933 RepID=F2RPQ3_TRIT1|nr:hypothetical protein TESG_00835 [Trichophyton tonsurans CBS 112818]
MTEQNPTPSGAIERNFRSTPVAAKYAIGVEAGDFDLAVVFKHFFEVIEGHGLCSHDGDRLSPLLFWRCSRAGGMQRTAKSKDITEKKQKSTRRRIENGEALAVSKNPLQRPGTNRSPSRLLSLTSSPPSSSSSSFVPFFSSRRANFRRFFAPLSPRLIGHHVIG